MTKDQARIEIEKLVNRYTEQQKSYHAADYNETKTRRDFIDPFFFALGWDMDNKNDVAEPYREVIHEDKVKIQGKVKAPDYGFRLQGAKDRLFFVEAKKPSVPLKTNKEAAFQVRRYGWNSRVAVSILTNFEEFIVYDCSKKPNANDSASVARLKTITYDQFLQEFDFIYDTFSREAVVKGRFDTYVKSDTAKKGTVTPDKDFVNSLEEWRRFIAIDIARNNLKLNEDELNFAVQLIIDRLIFLRFCEDRGVEHYGQLKSAVAKGSAYEQLHDIFIAANDKYNSGLFDFDKDKITQGLKVTNKVIKGIIDDMYYPLSQYDFKALPVEVLGNAYEQFLGKVIRINKAHHAVIEEKPEVRKAGGVFYTPQYIVDYIVENAVGKLIAGKTPKEIEKIKIVDPACGSGSFLLGAFDYLLKFHQNYYHQNPPSAKSGIITPIGTLSTAEKKKILLNNIYGVDLDANAVEVSKLSLLLKCMEGETEASIKQQITMFNERVLPDLDNNVKDGNSLIDTDIYDSEIDLGFERKIKPFSWKKAFPVVFKQGGFDSVIGNPPYGAEYGDDIKQYLSLKYELAIPIADTFLMFLKKAYTLAKENGIVSYIIPSTWLYMPQYNQFRRSIINQKTISEIQLFRKPVFEKVTVETCVLISTNTIPDKKTNYCFKEVKKEPSLFVSDDFIKGQLELLKDNESSLVLSNKEEQSLFNKIKTNKQSLSDVALTVCGLTPYRLGKGVPAQTDKIVKERSFDADYKKDKTYRQYLMGRDFNKYTWCIEKERWLSYGDWLAEPRYKAPFNDEKKIVIRQTSDKLIAHLDTNKYISLKNVHNLRVKNPNLSYEYLLALLNSKLLDWWYQKLIPEKGRVFAEVKVVNLEKLPIKILSDKNKIEKTKHDEIIKNVSLLLELNEDIKKTKLQTKIDQIKQRIEHAEDKINKLVYELYDLTPEEIAIIEESTSK
jgi:hypothetical protein